MKILYSVFSEKAFSYVGVEGGLKFTMLLTQDGLELTVLCHNCPTAGFAAGLYHFYMLFLGVS